MVLFRSAPYFLLHLFTFLFSSMQKKTLLSSVVLVSSLVLLTNARRDPNNPPTGNTGAPGETTCAKSGCHTGGNYSGTVTLTGIPDTVVPNQTYSITLTNASNAVRAGFQMTCFNGSNAMSGTFTAPQGSGVSIGSGANSKKYPRQSSPKTLSNGAAAWTFTWKAPATIVGDTATFYFASLCANGNGEKDGDNVLTSKKRVVLKAPVSASGEANAPAKAKVFPTVVQNGEIFVQLEESEQGIAKIFDNKGNLVSTHALSQNTRLNVSALSRGIYSIQIAADQKIAVKRIVVQ